MASALAMKSVTAAFSAKASVSARPQRRTVVQCVASQENEVASSRRMALGLFAAAAAASALSLAGEAQALTIASQESTGGLGRETGGKSSIPKNASAASMSGYTGTGTKKRGITPKRKAKVLDKVKAEAAKAAAPAPAPKK